MKTLANLITILLTVFVLSAHAQQTTINFDNGWPTEAVDLNSNAHVYSSLICGGFLELNGNGTSSGFVKFGPTSLSTGNIIEFDSCDSQPGNSGKIDVMEYDANHSLLSTTRHQNIASGICPSQTVTHTIVSVGVAYIGFQKATGSSVYQRIDNIRSPVPLPVELISFSGHMTENKIKLRWKTATETNNYGFEVQKKIDLGMWNAVGFVSGNGTSSTYHSYSYTDQLGNVPFSEARYRLKQIDRDGTFTYSNELVFSSTQPIVKDLTIYPNPMNDGSTATISFHLSIDDYVSIDLYNMQGERVKVVVDREYLTSGLHFRTTNLNGLPSGNYFVRLRYEGSTFSGRILIQ